MGQMPGIEKPEIQLPEGLPRSFYEIGKYLQSSDIILNAAERVCGYTEVKSSENGEPVKKYNGDGIYHKIVLGASAFPNIPFGEYRDYLNIDAVIDGVTPPPIAQKFFDTWEIKKYYPGLLPDAFAQAVFKLALDKLVRYYEWNTRKYNVTEWIKYKRNFLEMIESNMAEISFEFMTGLDYPSNANGVDSCLRRWCETKGAELESLGLSFDLLRHEGCQVGHGVSTFLFPQNTVGMVITYGIADIVEEEGQKDLVSYTPSITEAYSIGDVKVTLLPDNKYRNYKSTLNKIELCNDKHLQILDIYTGIAKKILSPQTYETFLTWMYAVKHHFRAVDIFVSNPFFINGFISHIKNNYTLDPIPANHRIVGTSEYHSWVMFSDGATPPAHAPVDELLHSIAAGISSSTVLEYLTGYIRKINELSMQTSAYSDTERGGPKNDDKSVLAGGWDSYVNNQFDLELLGMARNRVQEHFVGNMTLPEQLQYQYGSSEIPEIERVRKLVESVVEYLLQSTEQSKKLLYDDKLKWNEKLLVLSWIFRKDGSVRSTPDMIQRIAYTLH